MMELEFRAVPCVFSWVLKKLVPSAKGSLVHLLNSEAEMRYEFVILRGRVAMAAASVRIEIEGCR